MTDTAELVHHLWGLNGATLTPLTGGMNSQTWLVEHERAAFVAKQVSSERTADLVAGCELATELARLGLVTGRPVPTLDGRLVAVEHGLALLEHVPGRELTGESDQEQRWIARTLAGVHTAGGPADGPGASGFMTDLVSTDHPDVRAHPWLAGAVEVVRQETDPLPVTWSVLHCDPAPEAFIHDDRTGTTGLVDWTGARRGPVLYDVASVVMYLGGTGRAGAFLAEYERCGLVERAELGMLDAFRRFRWTVQAAYFAARWSAGDLTGIESQAENEEGLRDARTGLAELGVATTGGSPRTDALAP